MAWINNKIWSISSKVHYPYEWIFGTATAPTYIIKEITWNWYIDLTNAVAGQLLELKAYWWTVQRDVPNWYTQLDYITLNKCFFDTWITPTTDTDYEIKFTIAQNNTTQWIMWMLNNSTPTNNFYFMVSSWNKFLSALWTSAITLQWLSDAVVDTDYIAKVNWETLTVNGIAASNFTRWTLEATQTIDLWCRKNSENNWLTWKMYYFKIWKWWVLVAHYIPCKRNSDDVLWFYDIVNDTFWVLLTSYWTPVAWSDTVVPTPDIPIWLTCNNWVIKAKHQSGLPLGYTKIEYIEGDGNQYIDTGYFFNNIATETLTLDFMRTASSTGSMLYGTRTAYKNNGYAVQFTNAGATYIQWGDKDTGLGSTAAGALNTRYTAIRMGAYYSFNGADYTVTDAVTPTQNYPLYLFCVNNGGIAGTVSAMRIYSVVITDSNNAVKFNAIPCKNSSNVIGLYDTVSGTFMENKGTGSFTAGSEVQDDIVIYTDGTVETVNVHTKNLFSSIPYKTGYYIDVSGNEVESTQYQEEYIIRQAIVQPSTTYTVSVVGAVSGYTQCIHAYDKDGNRISQITMLWPSVWETAKYTFTSPANCRYIRQGGRSQSNYQLELGSTATTYVPYFDGGTATAEMLLGIWDYKDEQEVISGAVTRNVGIKVLDGTEEWHTASGTPLRFYLTLPNGSYKNTVAFTPYCTHCQGQLSATGSAATVGSVTDGVGFWYKNGASSDFEMYLRLGSVTSITDATTLKSYLSQQYANGTPVIIVYPLGTPTTETVTWQSLSVQSWTNSVEITQASIDDLPLEVTYKATE